MADAPYPLLTPATLERRVENVDERKLSLGLTDTDWTALLDEVIEEESAFVARLLREQGVDFADFVMREDLIAEYPVVRRAMIRLCRSSLHEIAEDGLEKESVGDHSETYAAPGTVRDSVREELSGIDVPTDTDGDGEPDTRISLI